MKRGDLATVVISGDFGKPRPALIIQSDQFGDSATVTVLPLSTLLTGAPLVRITIQPTPENGLHSPSQIMIDKAMTVKREKVGEPFGKLNDETMTAINRSLALFLGFG